MVRVMAQTGTQAGSYVFGAIFIGVWLYMALFEEQGWAIWGFIGLAFAGAIYGARVSNPGVRIGLYVALGIGLGMLIAAAVFQEIADILATVVTFVGGGLIVSALPAPGQRFPQESAS